MSFQSQLLDKTEHHQQLTRPLTVILQHTYHLRATIAPGHLHYSPSTPVPPICTGSHVQKKTETARGVSDYCHHNSCPAITVPILQLNTGTSVMAHHGPQHGEVLVRVTAGHYNCCTVIVIR